MARVLRAPLLHFLVIGALLLGLRTWREPAAAPRARIVIGAADRARLRETWTEEHGAPPSGAAEEALVRDAIDEEVLYREALARGFDRRDAAVRERLPRLGGCGGEEAGRTPGGLGREARRLGLARSELAGRRDLVAVRARPARSRGPRDPPLRTWVGPVRSSYGLHLVWVHAREPGRTPALAEVRGRVVQRWLRERSAQREREAMEEMRARYVVEVDGSR